MEYSVTINSVKFKGLHPKDKDTVQVKTVVQNPAEPRLVSKNTWSEYMQYFINKQLQLNLSNEKLDKILNEETRDVKINPAEQYEKLADGDKKALAHLVKAGKILDRVFIKQEHPLGLEFRKELEKRTADGDSLAQKTLTLYNIFNGIEDERQEKNYLFKNAKLSDGKNFYPADITKEELAKFLKEHPEKIEEILSNNTIVKRDEKGGFVGIPYQTEFKEEYEQVAKELLEASKTSTNEAFNEYLKLQAKALTSLDPEDACKADVAWIKLADTPLEFSICRECYSDAFTGKVLEDKELSELISKKNLTANSKDMIGIRVGIVEQKATKELADYKNHMKDFSTHLPLADTYKQSVDEVDPKTGSKQTLVDVDLVYMGGDSATSRPGVVLAQNLPNSDKLAAKRGAGNRNVFHRDFRKSYDPVIRKRFLEELIDESQRHLYSDDADHLFTIGHELTHSLGPMKTAQGLDKKSALGSWGDAAEEAKADLGSVLMADYFRKTGKYSQKQFEEIILTWCAGLLSQEPPSTEQPHGVRRVAQYNYMRENGGLTFEINGKMKVDFEKTVEASRKMLTEIIKMQLDGDAPKADEFFKKWFKWTDEQEYASKILKSMKPKIYRKLDFELANKIAG